MKASELKPRQFFEFVSDTCKRRCRRTETGYEWLAEDDFGCTDIEVTPLDVQGWDDESARDERLESVLAKLNGPPDAYRECVGNPRAVLARICATAEAKAKRKKLPEWSIIGDWAGHGSGVSAAIYEYYRKDSDAKPVEPTPAPPPKLQLREVDVGKGWRLLDKNEQVEEGDECEDGIGGWMEAFNWTTASRRQGPNLAYRRKITEVPPPVSEPKLQLREGVEYVSRDGSYKTKVVPYDGGGFFKWRAHGGAVNGGAVSYVYSDDGRIFSFRQDTHDLITEVPPSPIEQFAAEMREITGPIEIDSEPQEPQPDADGWIEHDGNAMPPTLNPSDEVQVKLDGEAKPPKIRAEYLHWEKGGGITHYRIVKPTHWTIIDGVEVRQ